MRFNQYTVALCLAASALLFSSVSIAQSKVEKERTEINQKSQQSLEKLYQAQPSARKAIAKAAGYAVFNQFSMKIMVAGSGSGKGYAMDNATKKKTYMKMVEVQAGLGIGVKKFTLVWVFDNKSALNKFVNSGWELGAQTNVTAVSKGKGLAYEGALSVSPGVWLYQLTNNGLSAELTVKGTKYYKDDDLN